MKNSNAKSAGRTGTRPDRRSPADAGAEKSGVAGARSGKPATGAMAKKIADGSATRGKATGKLGAKTGTVKGEKPARGPFADGGGKSNPSPNWLMTIAGAVLGIAVGFAGGCMAGGAPNESPNPQGNPAGGAAAVATDESRPTEKKIAWQMREYEPAEFVDGDTVRIMFVPPEQPHLTGVRLLNVNTPELRRGSEESKALGREATEKLRELIEGKKFRLEFEKDDDDWHTDSFGRLLAYVYVDEMNVNLEMVRLGYSKFYTASGEGIYPDKFRAAEAEAKKAKRGVWRLADNQVEEGDD